MSWTLPRWTSSLSAILAARAGLLRPEKIMSRLRGEVTQQVLSATVRLSSVLAADRSTIVPKRAGHGRDGRSAGASSLLAQPARGAALGVALDVLLLLARDAERARRARRA